MSFGSAEGFGQTQGTNKRRYRGASRPPVPMSHVKINMVPTEGAYLTTETLPSSTRIKQVVSLTPTDPWTPDTTLLSLRRAVQHVGDICSAGPRRARPS